MGTRLYRSQTDSVLGGVCGGLGQYLGIDPILARLFFVILTLATGMGVLAYLLLWVFVPREGQAQLATVDTVRVGADEIAAKARTVGDDLRGNLRGSNQQAVTIIGAGLIFLGMILLLNNLNIFWLRWLRFDLLWPLLLVATGGILIWRRVKRD